MNLGLFFLAVDTFKVLCSSITMFQGALENSSALGSLVASVFKYGWAWVTQL